MPANKTILVIEDDRSTIEILLLILQNAGYKVDVATDHNLGFLKTKIYPRLILLDHNLGQKNGSDICKELKNNDETNHIPIILISAMEDVGIIAKEACADDYIAKPFGIQVLLSKIEKALEKKDIKLN